MISCGQLKWYPIFALFLLSVCLKSVDSDTPCDTVLSNNCTAYGNYSECYSESGSAGICRCNEFVVTRPGDCASNCCLKKSSYGESCEENEQCQHLGPAKCNETTKLCDCLPDSVHYEGKCVTPKGLGQPCSEDNECSTFVVDGVTNELSTCSNGQCICYMNHAISLHSEETNGLCMVHSMGTTDDCKTVDISVLAITVAGSVVLILIIYLAFRLATKDQRKEENKKTPSFRPHEVKVDQHNVSP